MAPRSRDRRPPPPLDRAALEAAALAYLERYASSAENLRRVLMRRVRRHAVRSAHPREDDDTRATGDTPAAPDAAALGAIIEEIVARYTGARLIDDDAYARARASSLHRRGESINGIRAKLRAKGVGDGEVRRAVDALSEDSSADAVELEAAWKIARKRRLGPFRDDAELRAERRQKDIAALLRRGFSYSVAHRVVRTPPEAVPDPHDRR